MTDYLYYKKNYKGADINDKDEFERYAKMAVGYINSVINTDLEYKEEDISDCVCVLAERFYRSGDLGNIKSESVDGYSVTYSSDFGKELYEILKLYLPKELLYRGI